MCPLSFTSHFPCPAGPNKYDYTLDAPGQLVNLADNPSVATVNLDSIFIHNATVE
eukprot:COSAG02_NODE_42534_length_383_cov_1.545775_1_plen_54_part_10